MPNNTNALAPAKDETPKPGHNQPPKMIASTYEPLAITNEALEKERDKTLSMLTDFANTGDTTLTLTLARLAADITFAGTKELREGSTHTIEPLKVNGKEYSFSMIGAVQGDKALNYHEQIVTCMRDYWLRPRGEEDDATTSLANEATIRNLIPGAVKKAILLAFGVAEIAVFERRGSRIRPEHQGTPIAEMPNPDKKKFVTAIAVHTRKLAPVVYKLEPVRGSEKQVRNEKSGEPNAGNIRFYLSTPCADALYRLFVEGGKESDVTRDPQGFLTGLKRESRATGGTQAEGGVAALSGIAGTTEHLKAFRASLEQGNKIIVSAQNSYLGEMALTLPKAMLAEGVSVEPSAMTAIGKLFSAALEVLNTKLAQDFLPLDGKKVSQLDVHVRHVLNDYALIADQINSLVRMLNKDSDVILFTPNKAEGGVNDRIRVQIMPEAAKPAAEEPAKAGTKAA